MGAHLRDSVLGAAPPLAIFSCLVAGAEPAVLVAVALALIACALIYRLAPGPAPLATDLPFPALVFGLLPLLQAVPLPEFIWMRLTAVDAALRVELSALGVILPSTWSFQPEGTLRFGVVVIAAVAVFLLARDAATRPVSRWVLIGALIALTGWQSLEGLRQYFAGLWMLDDGEVAHGSFVNRGYYAAFVNSGICLAVGAAYSQASRSALSPARVTLVIASVFTALVSLVAIVCSQSRSAAVVAGVLLLLALAILPLHRRNRAALALAAVACGVVFLSASFASPLLERFGQLHDQGGDPGRLLIWRDSLASLSPLGAGAGSFPWAFRREAPYFL